MQDITTDRMLLGKHLKLKWNTPPNFPSVPRRQYTPLTTVADWYDYYVKYAYSGADFLKHKLSRDIKYRSEQLNEEDQRTIEYLRMRTWSNSMLLTLLAALEATMPDLSTRKTIHLHLLGAHSYEFSAAMDMGTHILHFLPALTTLVITSVNPYVQGPFEKYPGPVHGQPYSPYGFCCADCKNKNRRMIHYYYKGEHHEYTASTFYQKPDLAAAIRSGFSVCNTHRWRPTIELLVKADHPTLFTDEKDRDIELGVEILEELGANFVQKWEVNRWKGLFPELVSGGTSANEVVYKNRYWCIIGKKDLDADFGQLKIA